MPSYWKSSERKDVDPRANPAGMEDGRETGPSQDNIEPISADLKDKDRIRSV